MMNKQLTVLLLFLVLMFSLSDAFWATPFKIAIVKASVSSSWHYNIMGYRVEHNVTGSPAGNQTNYQMKITIVNGTGTSNESVYYTTHVNQSDFDDVRFTWSNTTSGEEEEIDYWREEVNSGSNATFWVEIPEVINVTDNTIYVYYGNNNTATTSNVNATFVRVIDGNQPIVLALPVDEGSGNKTHDQSGNKNDGTLHPTPVEVNNCDNTTDWSGTSLSSETIDKVEGSASVKDTITSPTAGTDYNTSYNFSGSWDWSSKNHVVFWLKCDRASTAFTNARLVLVDPSNRERYWDMCFDADEWTRIKKKLDTFDEEDTGFDLAAVDKVFIRFKTADTTDFYKLVDYIEIDDGPQWIDGKFGKALSFDGEDDYVDCGNHLSLNITDEITIEAWIYQKSTATYEYQMYLIGPYGGWQGYCLRVGTACASALFGNGVDGWQTFNGRTVYGLDAWHHIAMTYKKNGMAYVYLDGEEDGSSSVGNLDSGTFTRVISHRIFTFNGTIDEVRIYNRALTAEEISDLYDYHGYTTTNYAGRVLVRKWVDPEPGHGAWGSEVRYVPVRDIAVVSVAPSSTEVIKDNSINILVEVRNEGTESENFNVTVYYDNNIIDTQTNISLKPGDNKVLIFTWNTTDVFPGTYEISAQASIVPGETDTGDNIFTDGPAKVIIGYPIAYVTYSPVKPLVNETVTLNATLSTPNGGNLINYTWDFGDGFNGNGVIVFHNYSKAGTYNVTLTVTDSEEVNNASWVTITVFTHNVAIISITPSTNEIYEGQTMDITVVVQNSGNLTETFNVTIYANTTIVQTQAVSNLAPNNQTTLTSIWNTAGASPGNYAIKAEASIIPEETYAAQTITVRTPPSWYAPLVTWLIGIPPLIWVGISILLLMVTLFRLKIIEVKVEKQLEPAEELRHQISRLLQPLAEKDERFILLQQFLHQLLEKNPPPETIEFLQNTFPITIKAVTEPKDETKKRKRVRAQPVTVQHQAPRNKPPQKMKKEL